MKSLDTDIVCTTELECAELVIETVLLGMKTIRAEVRCSRPIDVSVPQFRILAFLKHHEGASLSDVADHIGLTLPSVSKAIDGLVKRGLVSRETSSDDRRRVILTLTESGTEAFTITTDATKKRITERLSVLSEEDKEIVTHSMQILSRVFSKDQDCSCRPR